MANPKNRQEARLHALINAAREKNIQVRMEKLLREVGYRAHSGRCRINGREVIVLDRDASVSDQIEFLLTALAQPSESAGECSISEIAELSARHSGQAGDS